MPPHVVSGGLSPNLHWFALWSVIVWMPVFCIPQSAQAYPSVYPTGVTRYDPDKAYNGYILLPMVTNYGASAEVIREPDYARLLDMNGNLVKDWPEVNSWQRYRLQPNCSIMAIEEGEVEGLNAIVEFDWNGDELWRWSPEQQQAGGRLSPHQSHHLHHDFELLQNGELLVMYSVQVPEEKLELVEDVDWPYFGKIRRKGVQLIGDELAYVNREGEITWTWTAHDHIDVNEFAPAWRRIIDWTHGNAVRAIPENKWYDNGDERFKPGNVVYNTRNLPYFWVIDRASGEVVYKGSHRYLGGFAGQHEAHMIPKGFPGAGNFLVFDNGAYGPNEDHMGKTLIVEIDPSTNRIVWKYEAAGRAWRFYSHSRGSVQRLPNGNTLISEDNTGRIFQVRPDEDHPDGGEIVWEYVAFNSDENPLWALARAHVYPYDYCSDMEKLPRSELRVTPPVPSEWKLKPDVQRESEAE